MGLVKIIKILKDFISPKKCYGCNKEGIFLCENCFNNLNNFSEICFVCKKYSKNYQIHKICLKKYNIFLDKVIILTSYKNNLIKKIIINGKYNHRKDVFEDIGLYLASKLLNNINTEKNKEDYIIISSPMYFYKKMLRGYNQADILADIVSRKTGIIFIKNLVKKIKNTNSQAKLSKVDRLKNLNNVFIINNKLKNNLIGKKVVIIDDIITTGSTLNEISKLLKSYGVKEVIGLVIASN